MTTIVKEIGVDPNPTKPGHYYIDIGKIIPSTFFKFAYFDGEKWDLSKYALTGTERIWWYENEQKD